MNAQHSGEQQPRWAEDIARRFHETYERLAPDFGYETRSESAVPWEDVPETNRLLMQAVVAFVFVEAGPFGAGGHGLGCGFRKGHQCDCTARNGRYFTLRRSPLSGSSGGTTCTALSAARPSTRSRKRTPRTMLTAPLTRGRRTGRAGATRTRIVGAAATAKPPRSWKWSSCRRFLWRRRVVCRSEPSREVHPPPVPASSGRRGAPPLLLEDARRRLHLRGRWPSRVLHPRPFLAASYLAGTTGTRSASRPPRMDRCRVKLLDLFCGAGGASMGYHRAGFDVTGVDIEPHPAHPFPLVVADALEVDLDGFDAYHASPPCQGYTTMTRHADYQAALPKLIAPIRERLAATGKPYVIENVPGALAHLRSPIELTGEMFGLGVHRPRLFESNVMLLAPPRPRRQHNPAAVYGKNDGRRLWTRRDGTELRVASLEQAREAMGIDWMDWDDLREAIPPAYTEHVGGQLMAHLEERAA